MTNNRKSRLLFMTHRSAPVRISNRMTIVMYNRSGDVCAYGALERSARQNRARNRRIKSDNWAPVQGGYRNEKETSI